MSNMTQTDITANDIEEMRFRYFDLYRKYDFFTLDYVPNEREAATMYTREETGRDGVVRHFPCRALRCCPDPADDAEMERLQDAIEAAGVRMWM